MADKESKLNLRLTAQNEASSAFTAISEAMNSLKTNISEARSVITSDFRTITDSITSLSGTFESLSNSSQPFTTLESNITGLENIARDAATQVGESFSSIKTAIESITKTSESLSAEEKSIQSLGSVSSATEETIAKAFGSLETSVSASVLAIRQQTETLKTAIESVGTTSEETGNKIDKGSLFVGLQMLGQSMEHVGSLGEGLFKDAISQSADFEQSMSNIKAALVATGTPMQAANDMVDQMKAKALDLGSHYHRSATEIGNAFDALVRQGVSAKDVLNGAGQAAIQVSLVTKQDLGETATVISDVYNEFKNQFASNGKSMQDNMNEVANTTVGAMLKAKLSTNDYITTMKQVGPVASNMHQSVTDVSTAIALLAEHGIKGSVAGTTLKNMLMGLEPHTKKAAEIMHDLGISAKDGAANSFYDLHGNLKPLPDIIGILNEKFGNLNDHQKEAALAATFTKYGLAGLNVVVSEGKDKFNELRSSLQGVSAERAANIMMDNLAGDMMLLKANTETLSKSFGDSIHPEMRKLTESTDGLVQKFEGLSPETKHATMEVLGIGSALAIAGGAILGTLSTIGFLQMGLKGIGLSFGSLFQAVGRGFWALIVGIEDALGGLVTVIMANPIAALITAIVVVVAGAAYEIYMHWDSIKTFLTKTWEAIKTTAENVWTSIKTFSSKLWNDIVTSIQNVWNGFTSWISGAAHEAVQWVVDAFDWMYNHNYYFQDLVDFISKAWTSISTTASEVWNSIGNFLSTTWEGIKSTADAQWNFITGVLSKAWEGQKKLSADIMGPVVKFFSGLWESISTDIDSAWSSIKTAIGNWWNGIVSDGESIFNGLGTFFSNLWNEAYNWGLNLVHMVGEGIKHAASEVADAAKEVAGQIAKFLGFHSPTEEGPASDSDKWAPNFVKMFAGGLKDGASTVADAANSLISPLADSFNALTGGAKFDAEHIGSTVQLIINAKKAYAQAAANSDQAAMDSAHKLADEYRANLESMGVNSKLFSQDVSVEDSMKNLQMLAKQSTTSAKNDHYTMTTDMMANNSVLSSNTAMNTADITKSWTDTRNATVKVVMDLGNSLKAIFGFIKANVELMCSSIQTTFTVTFQSIADSAVASMNRVLSAMMAIRAATASASAASMGGDGMGQIAQSVPSFGQGGKVTKPTLAIVGEGGEPEYIVPESKLRGQSGYTMGLPQTMPFSSGSAARGGRGDVHFHGNIIVQTNGKDGRQIGNDIMSVLRREVGFSL